MTYDVTIGGTTRTIAVERAESGYQVSVDGGAPKRVDARRLGSILSLIVDDLSFDAGLVRRKAGWDVNVRGTLHECAVVDPRRAALRLAGGAGEGTLSSSMPGRVVRVLVAAGDAVSAGAPVMVIEAMKMENELKAPIDGVIREVFVAEGDKIDTGARLLEVVAPE